MAEDHPLPPVLTPKRLAEALDCSQRHIWNLAKSGKLQSFKIGPKLLRIRREAALAYWPSLSAIALECSPPEKQRPASLKAPKTPPVRRRAFGTTRLIAEIESWEWDYHFGVTKGPGSSDQWQRQEFRHLYFRGNLIRPSRFKLRKIKLTLIPDGRDVDGTPSGPSIGHLGRSRSQWEPLIGIPTSALSPILAVVDFYRLFVLEVGPDLRSADIRSFSLRKTVDDEELLET